jgi:SAM-dependent methyltransferase
MDTLISSFLHKSGAVYVKPTFALRLDLCRAWGITSNSRLLDIGCGQGYSILVLALLVGPSGHVTGIDNAPPEYGGPYTLKESHAYVKNSVLGDRITFVRSETPEFLVSYQRAQLRHTERFDGAVLCHSLWYFASRRVVATMFQSLAEAIVPRLYLAEFAFQASRPEQVPHVLASRAQALLHSFKAPRETGAIEPNVRTALSPDEILQIAEECGWRLASQGVIQPPEDHLDGFYEYKYIESSMFVDSVKAEKLTSEQENEIFSYVPLVKQSVKELGGQRPRTMDVCWTVLELDV